MSFLQPWLLAGLPLLALPVVIHLINQRRFQTIHWAAMMFLLAAHRMARGYSRLRQWLIMLLRMGAIAALVLAVSRPLASGWLGLTTGGKPDTTIILLDRSPSMQQRSRNGGGSKLDTGRQQLAQTLETLGSGRWLLIESTTHKPIELDSPAALMQLPSAGPASAPADLALMLQAAYEYIRDQRPGQTDIWICSDLRANDWTADSGRWASLQAAFVAFPQGVRLHLLAYPQVADGNVAVRVTQVQRRVTSEGAELLLSLKLSRTGGDLGRLSLPVQLEVEGARSVVTVDMNGPLAEFKEHRIPIEPSRERGWGRVSIPADTNPADDVFYFVFDNPPPRRTLVVADDPLAAQPLALAAGIAPEPGLACSAELATLDQLPTVDWQSLGLVLWQAPLPTGQAAEFLQAHVRRGGQVVFFPPREPTADESWGLSWQSWNAPEEPLAAQSWRNDEDLLARTLDGAALPVGQLEVRRYCGLSGTFLPLATLNNNAPLLVRVPSDRGGVYFWTTTPSAGDSSLATEGVVLYAFVQRSLAAGAATLGKALELDAGDPGTTDPAHWRRLRNSDETLSTEGPFQHGVYACDDRLLAINRPSAEDESGILADARVSELFRGLDYSRVNDQTVEASSLIQEIWRVFLIAMLTALVAEASLCLPRLGRVSGAGA